MPAVGTDRISKVLGYQLTAGNFATVTPNLTQRVLIIGEGNEANQATMPTELTEINSAQEAGEKYGYGSQIYNAMRILRPSNGGGIGGIKTFVGAQLKASGAAAKILDVTPSGTATGNGTHTLVIAGRENVDGERYDFNIVTGDTVADITEKIEDVINNVLGSPFLAVDNTTKLTATSKWMGLTADKLSIEINTNGDALGITYVVSEDQAASGTPSVTSTLNLIGSQWVTAVCNTYGEDTNVMDALEAYNGKPDETLPTGRYSGIVFKPFIAITGSTSEDPSAITDARKTDVTIAIAPAPKSAGLPSEAAANATLLYAVQAQNSPHLDISGMVYPDMPTPSEIGAMDVYNNRDVIVKKGCSTVQLNAGQYEMVDFVTTYHPVGEIVPQHRYVRSLTQDFNIKFGYRILEEQSVIDHTILADDDTSSVKKTVKPKQWKAVVTNYADGLSDRALIAEPDFMKESIEVSISTTNPDRFETFFRYKRSGFARILSTEAQAGFNFGTNN